MSTVTVQAHMRSVREDDIAIWTGAYHSSGKEAWDWLPRSQVTWVYWSKQDRRRVTVTMPEDLAREKCLAYRRGKAA